PTGASYPSELIVYNSKLYFDANDGANGYELWVSDGTSSGTQMVKDINPTNDGNPYYFKVYNNELYFIATDGTGYQLWESDGSSNGTKSILPLIAPNASPVVSTNAFVIFTGSL